MKIDIQKLLEKGYKEFPLTGLNSHAEKGFQKAIIGEDGNIMYYITVYMYCHYIIQEITWEVATQLYQQGTHEPVNLKFFCDWSLADVEDYIQRIYNVGFEPYEEDAI